MADLNENDIINLYVNEKLTLRNIARIYNTDHHRIKRILDKNSILINNKNRKREALTEEHKKNISKSCKGKKSWNKNRVMPKSFLYKNMKAHLHWNIELEFLEQFEDVEKLKELNRIITKDRVAKYFDEEKYKQFILKFYNDDNFNKQFEIYKKSKDKYDRPSLDHIIPLSRNGNWEFKNLQIISWFENRAKCDLTQEEFESKIKEYFK